MQVPNRMVIHTNVLEKYSDQPGPVNTTKILFTPGPALCFLCPTLSAFLAGPRPPATGTGPGRARQHSTGAHCSTQPCRLLRTCCRAAGCCWSRAKLRQHRAELPGHHLIVPELQHLTHDQIHSLHRQLRMN